VHLKKKTSDVRLQTHSLYSKALRHKIGFVLRAVIEARVTLSQLRAVKLSQKRDCICNLRSEVVFFFKARVGGLTFCQTNLDVRNGVGIKFGVVLPQVLRKQKNVDNEKFASTGCKVIYCPLELLYHPL
jgi:hypothetical protein